MKLHKLFYIATSLLLLLWSCRVTKLVPEGSYLLKKNTVKVVGGKLDESDLELVPRLKPNNKYIGIKFRLAAYTAVDSAKVAQKRIKKNIKLRLINAKRSIKNANLNDKRIQKAIKKGKTSYNNKTVVLKDTIEPHQFFREWLKYKIGEAPVLLDTQLVNRSLEQFRLYMNKKGYYEPSIKDTIIYKKKKAAVKYTIQTGEPYRIDSIYYLISNNPSLRVSFVNFVQKETALKKGMLLDEDILDDTRSQIARAMRDSSFYGFDDQNIYYVADTNALTHTSSLGIGVKPRTVRISPESDSVITMQHQTHRISNVYFHISDTAYYKGNFKAHLDSLELPMYNDQHFVQTLDTIFYQRKGHFKELSSSYFLYNTKLNIKPQFVELKNYLEHGKYYKAYYLERSYSQLLSMDVWQAIKPILIENPYTNKVEVHYFLIPAKKQSYTFEPRATNSNGYLGVSASVNYVNKNLFRGGEKLTISVTGGFESYPPVFDKGLSDKKIKKTTRSFNVFEIGPTLRLELPGLFPIKATAFSKRQTPTTNFALSYYYQTRSDFTRNLLQFNYDWKWLSGKTQTFTFGFPFLSVINFSGIKKSVGFQQRLNQLNDLFLLNTYSSQLIFQDWKVNYVWSNVNLEKKNVFSYHMNFDIAGNLLNWTTKHKLPDSLGVRSVFGVPFSQFVRLDNEFKLYQNFSKKHSLNYRLQLGAGLPYGNSKTSLPFGYSFFAGGTNDNRGWRARELGPGGYKYYLDSNRTATQVGDIRIGGSVEYRFDIGGIFKGAFFADAGNVWLMKNDSLRPGAQFSAQFINQFGIAGGLGLRVDLKFLIIRFDVGFPLRNPALPKGANWVFSPRDAYYSELADYYGNNYKTDPDLKSLLHPFTPRFHIGIGYPF